VIEPVAQGDGRLTVALLEVSDRKLLEEATQRRGQRLFRLAALLGHDLRSVLNVMSLHAQLAKASLRDAGPHAPASLDTIVTTAHDAAKFMTQLQEYAAALTHHADLDRVSLQHIVAQVLAELDSQVRSARAVVELGELPRVLSKEAILARLLFCLVENRLRLCSAPEPRIEIAAVSGSGRRGALGLVIRDNGTSVNKHEQERAFAALFRNDGSERPGTGLALGYCREYIEDIGGSVWLECWPNQGAQIVVLLPGG
jgi:light-regulated signal transduction histidine kinase (bacteriophytochrome)